MASIKHAIAGSQMRHVLQHKCWQLKHICRHADRTQREGDKVAIECCSPENAAEARISRRVARNAFHTSKRRRGRENRVHARVTYKIKILVSKFTRWIQERSNEHATYTGLLLAARRMTNFIIVFLPMRISAFWPSLRSSARTMCICCEPTLSALMSSTRGRFAR